MVSHSSTIAMMHGPINIRCMTSLLLNVNFRGTAMKSSRNHNSVENTSFWIKPALKFSGLLKMMIKFAPERATKGRGGAAE